MSNATDITYILGAGASCKAMPLVSNFSQRFNSFLFLIKNNHFHSIESLLKHGLSFAQQIKSHLSFDTFFKKLFHQKQESEIETYKSVLLAFFLYEHLLPIENQESYGLNPFEKEYCIDPRYDALIAGLLKPLKDETTFYTGINIVTWNYDVNLEFSIHNFLYHDQPFYEFLERRRDELVFKFGQQVKVIHLNGFIYHKSLNYLFARENFETSMQSIITDFYNGNLNQWSKFIKFSWESDAPTNIICDWISSSSTIVLIGYSLPLYNRMIDTKFINPNTIDEWKTLIIQDLKADEIKSLLDSDFKVSDTIGGVPVSGLPRIKITKNCNSFVVPNSIF